jgi:predicted nucleic acid-binding protein
MVVEADSGPRLHLHWVGASAWALPPAPIDVVEAVWREVASYAPDALRDTRLSRIAATFDPSPELSTFTLDDGEAAALADALRPEVRRDALLLCDELRARRACKRLALPVVGSIGLVIEACRAGRASREQATSALSDLPGRGRLHVSPALIRAAIDALA